MHATMLDFFFQIRCNKRRRCRETHFTKEIETSRSKEARLYYFLFFKRYKEKERTFRWLKSNLKRLISRTSRRHRINFKGKLFFDIKECLMSAYILLQIINKRSMFNKILNIYI